MTAKRFSTLTSGVIMGAVSLVWLVPVYFMVINSFKPLQAVVFHTARFPEGLYLDNILQVWRDTRYFRLFLNSTLVTAVSVAGMVLMGSMAGFRLSRLRSRFKPVLLVYFLLTLIIPFQAVMIPLVVVMRNLGLINSIPGLCLVYMAYGSPMAIFLYHGFAATLPRALEESAIIDGCGPGQVFFRIIFPLMKPMTSTVVILQSLYIWNDFLLPLITLQTESFKTIPLGITAKFFGQYAFKWNLGITAMLLASLPMLLLYFFLQKYIIDGVVQGAVKG